MTNPIPPTPNASPSDASAPGVRAVKVPAAPKVREWARARGVTETLAARIAKVSPRPKSTLDGLLRQPPKYIRVNPLRGGVKEVRARLEAQGFEFRQMDLDPNVLRIDVHKMSPGATMEHLLGFTTPQDLASASAPLALGAEPGDIVVDLAAAPGVKSLHIAGDMNDRGSLICVDPNPQRLRALRFNLERCGVTSALLHECRGEDLAARAGDEPFADRILLDAPCTGEGTMPRDKNRRRASLDEVQNVTPTQQSLLDAADRMLIPGGTLVYATCTFGPEENEVMVQRMIDRGYEVEALPFSAAGGVPLVPGVTDWPGHDLDDSIARSGRFFPGIHPTLGFFVARLHKPMRVAV